MADDMFRKIQGLIAKAEGTDNENEAAAFYGKAQELMLRYAIDEARIRESLGMRTAATKPIMVDFEYSSSDSNAVGKRNLLNSIARTNRVRMINHNNRRGYWKMMGKSDNVASQWCALVGYESDIAFVKIMFASLLVQSARYGNVAWTERSKYGAKSGKSRFYTAYLLGFSQTVYLRLKGMSATPDPDANALVVRIDEEVNDAFKQFFPNTRSVAVRGRDAYGMSAGQRDGHKADLGQPSLSNGQGLRLGSGK